ncbi:hypothetical protein MRX96_023352 [Rhipicephalus microplus]
MERYLMRAAGSHCRFTVAALASLLQRAPPHGEGSAQNRDAIDSRFQSARWLATESSDHDIVHAFFSSVGTLGHRILNTEQGTFFFLRTTESTSASLRNVKEEIRLVSDVFMYVDRLGDSSRNVAADWTVQR